MKRVLQLFGAGIKSMHKRLLLGLALGWIVIVFALLVSTWFSGQRQIREVNDTHLKYEATLIAEQVQQELSMRLDSLQRLGGILDPDMVDNATYVHAKLAQNDPLLELFDALTVIGRDGRVVSRWPEPRSGADVDVSDRLYFRFIRSVRRPYVSEPFVSRFDDSPLIMLGVPLEDSSGDFLGMVGGVIDILDGSLFDRLRRIRIGSEGHARILTSSGRVLVHPQSSWILESAPSAEQNPWLDLALSGWEGTALGPTIDGNMALQAYEQVWLANWVVGVFLPREQAYAPLEWFVRHLWLVGGITVLVMLALLWWLLNQALRPLHSLECQIEAVGQGHRDFVDVDTRALEIQRVADTFNRMAQSRRETESRLHDRQAFLDAVLASSPVGMFVYNLDGEIRYVNPAMVALTGYSLEQFRSRGHAERAHPADRDDVADLWRSSLSSGRDFQRQYRYLKANGEVIWVESHASLVRMESGAPLGFVGTLKDITEHQQVAALQRWEAEHDPLTGLLNRRGFERRLDEALADWVKGRVPAALILFDLDHFKPINDEGGHALGDEMLKMIADTIATKVRKSDFLARYGGDEFAVLMPGCGLEQARQTAEALRRTVETLSVEHAGKRYRVTLSLGVTDLHGGDSDSDHPMRRADQASYLAKEQGRNRIVVTDA
ncbi:diguanylate cyclase [Halomonas sp. HP20-15]|uniref:sensor domain-containing diguanylate cyclase n=1 Tax=Halomonas sp. HP20-15 TaxID=3085901 RepID=UPI002980E495|nr:diguanylate cyclase [Halomonas sp. HP20-15]MDW5377898.1 diguanylate cyclase [Halomonas sp. HP20-15]